MFSTAVVIFREILEIAIIFSVIMAATKDVTGRSMWAGIGVGLGMLGSIIVAYFISEISNWAQGVGQEIFNAGILLTAAAVIGWTVLWMRSHAKEMVAKLKHVGQGIKDGDKHLFSISLIIALAFLREGSEIVLFGNGILASGNTNWRDFIIGAIIGLSSGVFVGVLIYLGLLKISTKYIFKVTSWLLIFLAAGMSLNAAGYLVSAGVIETWVDPVWNISSILPNSSLLGKFLGTLIGYTASPMGIQLVFYVITLSVLGTSIFIIDNKFAKNRAAAA